MKIHRHVLVFDGTIAAFLGRFRRDG
jgi:hypothetical protein